MSEPQRVAGVIGRKDRFYEVVGLSPDTGKVILYSAFGLTFEVLPDKLAKNGYTAMPALKHTSIDNGSPVVTYTALDGGPLTKPNAAITHA